jgi:hypothetical protein
MGFYLSRDGYASGSQWNSLEGDNFSDALERGINAFKLFGDEKILKVIIRKV